MKRWGWMVGVALLSACTTVASAEAPVSESADEQPMVDEQPVVDEQSAADEPVEPEAAQAEAESEDPPQATAVPLPDLGPAPELQNEVWLNVDAPLRLADLRGQVVLLDMWTFG